MLPVFSGERVAHLLCYFVCITLVTLCCLCLTVFHVWSLSLDYILLIPLESWFSWLLFQTYWQFISRKTSSSSVCKAIDITKTGRYLFTCSAGSLFSKSHESCEYIVHIRSSSGSAFTCIHYRQKSQLDGMNYYQLGIFVMFVDYINISIIKKNNE